MGDCGCGKTGCHPAPRGGTEDAALRARDDVFALLPWLWPGPIDPLDADLTEAERVALHDLTLVLTLGPYLAWAPWVVHGMRDVVRVVKGIEARQTGRGGSCGMTWTAYLPFDPTEVDWPPAIHHGAFAAPEEMPAHGGEGAAEMATSKCADSAACGPRVDRDRKSGRDKGGRSLGRGGSIGRRGGDDPKPGGPKSGDGNGQGAFSCEDFVDTYRFAGREADDVRGRGILFARATNPIDERPMLDVLCAYVGATWRAMDEEAGPGGLPEETPFVTFPYDAGSGGGFGRSGHLGWPSAPGGPTGVHVASVEPALGARAIEDEILQRAVWLRCGDVWVMSDEGLFGNGLNRGGFGARELERDAIGLALRFLKRSMPELRGWESRYALPSGGFGFQIGSADIVQGMASYLSDEANLPLHIVVRRDTAPEAGYAGRAHPPHLAITLARGVGKLETLGWAAECLRLFREAIWRVRSVVHFHPDADLYATFWDEFPRSESVAMAGDVPATMSMLGLCYALSELAALILHEAGHCLPYYTLGEMTGVAHDWYTGPSIRPQPAGGVVSPALVDYPFSPGVPDIPGAAMLFPHTVQWQQWAPLQGAPLPIITRHYVLSLFEAWFLALARHNLGPLNRFQNGACKCVKGTADPRPRANPLHWGWLDGVCWQGNLEFASRLVERDIGSDRSGCQ